MSTLEYPRRASCERKLRVCNAWGSIREIEAAARQPMDEAQLNEITASGIEVRTRFERACERACERALRVCACAHILL